MTFKKGENLQVTVNVTNTGKREGEEVVQLYVRDLVGSVTRPVKELKGFQRIALKPGQTKRVEFTITRRELQFWSDKGWVAEPGEFKVWIGPGSAAGLEGTFSLVTTAGPTSRAQPQTASTPRLH